MDQLAIRLEAAMTQVFRIVNVSRWSMGNDQIDAVFQPDPRSQPPDHAIHLRFGVLDRTAIVPAGPFKAQQLEPAVADDSAVKVDASRNRCLPVADIVIAADIVKWCAEGASQKFEILRRQVTARDDEVDLTKTIRVEVPIELRHHHI